MFLWWGVRISIHALLAESDKLEKYGIKMQGLFLSTLSLRRATLELFLYYQDNTISIHALLAESDRHIFQVFAAAVIISIHALLAESDRPPRVAALFGRCYFYPRSPCGERLNEDRYGQQYWRFLSTLSLRRATGGFAVGSWRLVIFLSTLSLRRATRYGRPIDVQLVFLSTLSLRRAT